MASEYDTAVNMANHYKQRVKALLIELDDALLEDREEDTDSLTKKYKSACSNRDYWQGMVGKAKTDG